MSEPIDIPLGYKFIRWLDNRPMCITADCKTRSGIHKTKWGTFTRMEDYETGETKWAEIAKHEEPIYEVNF